MCKASAGFRLPVAKACYSPRLRIRYRPTEPAIPFPPPLHKAALSAFPPLAENGRFPPLTVVDNQAKTPERGRGPNPQSSGQEAIALRKLRCCLRSSTVSRRGPFCPWVLRRLTRIPIVRTAVSASGGGRPGTATGTSLQQDGETCRKARQRGVFENVR